MNAYEVVVEGVGLHSGHTTRVVLRPAKGPVRLLGSDGEAAVSQLQVSSTARATTVEGPGGRARVGTVEHAFAALAGLGVYEGLVLDVTGPEMPLLDGGALGWCEALGRLDLTRGRPRLRVTRDASFEVGPSLYELSPGEGIDVQVHVELDARFDAEARWQGDPVDFAARIAPARTFTLSRDVEELVRRGLARHVDPGSVVVIAPDSVLSAGRDVARDEPARHKLLDLMGDLYVHGGPPLGRIRVTRPGHASNARAFRHALDEGILVHGVTWWTLREIATRHHDATAPRKKPTNKTSWRRGVVAIFFKADSRT